MDSKNNSEEIHYIKMLTELVLYPKIKILKEIPSKNTVKDRESIIKDFIENLPAYLKKVDGYGSIVIETLRKVEKNIEDINDERKQENNGTSRNDDDREM